LGIVDRAHEGRIPHRAPAPRCAVRRGELGHVEPVERALVEPEEDVGVPVEDGQDRLVADAVQLHRQGGPRPGRKVEDVDRIGQRVVSVDDVECIDELSKETLGIRPIKRPARGRSQSSLLLLFKTSGTRTRNTHGRPVVVNA